jgi:glycosyltransferase involved in cell wall biosynthesis
MRIVHAIHSIDPDKGGPTAVVMRLASAQSRMGHEVHIVGTLPASRERVLDAYQKDIQGSESVRLHITPPPNSILSKLRARAMLDSLRSIDNNHVLHLHGMWCPCLPRAGAWARKHNTPYVVMPHGMLDTWSLRQGAMKKKIALSLVYRSFINHASSIHALNQHEADTIGALGVTPQRDVIPNGVFLDEVELETEPDEFRRSIPELGDKPYFLFLSRLHFKKGLDILADAWTTVSAAHPELRLVVAGPCEDDSADDFKRRIGDAGLSETVFLPGAIYGTRKTAAFRETLAFVLPSRQEGFSIAITEALGLGTPVVITHECHFPEVEQADAGIVTTLDAGAFASAMREIASDQPRRAEMGVNAATLVRENYTWPRIAEQTIELYRSIGV